MPEEDESLDDCGIEELYPEVIKRYPDNAAIRTSARWDAMVRHLGYEPVDIKQPGIPTDVELIEQSQKRLASVQALPDDKLTPQQLSSLELARAVIQRNVKENLSVYAAVIPAASERVKTAGLFARRTRTIYLSLDQLDKGKRAVETAIHEAAHDMSQAEDGEPKHQEQIGVIAGSVVKDVSEKKFDSILSNPSLAW